MKKHYISPAAYIIAVEQQQLLADSNIKETGSVTTHDDTEIHKTDDGDEYIDLSAKHRNWNSWSLNEGLNNKLWND